MEQTYCYVGLKPCGCCEAATVIAPKWAADNAKFCADLIKAGYTVERKPVEWVRENLLKCDHKPETGTLPLFASTPVTPDPPMTVHEGTPE